MRQQRMLLRFSFYHRNFFFAFCIILFLCSSIKSIGQKKDSLIVHGDSSSMTISIADSTTAIHKDSVKKRVYVPRTAAIRSAILPGLGQVYNRKYWKVGLVYAALGATAYVFFDNLKTYKDSRFAYSARIKAAPPTLDSTDFNKLSYPYQYLYTTESIKANRDQFRRYIDYSVLVFIVLWGLNVVDATVDAHLKSFDVSPDLALRFKIGHSEIAGTNGISLVLNYRDKHRK
ncbi:MAG: DUF5683 domain-containing protein [Bacteroidota bacterium]